jgi:hypothetical protein
MPGEPQQSASVRQISPVGRQPLGGWHTKTPVGPYGAQERLQHSPPQAGIPASFKTTPPSPVAPAPQTWPAIKQPVVPGASGSVQVPTAAPDCLVQIPAQHSSSVAHASPVWKQNDGRPEHLPPEQYLEQHSPWPPQVLPAVLHSVFSGWHTAFAQVPLQHCALPVQAWLSEVHAFAPQRPPSHTTEQHSVGAVQLAPPGLQLAPSALASPAPPPAPLVPPAPGDPSESSPHP